MGAFFLHFCCVFCYFCTFFCTFAAFLARPWERWRGARGEEERVAPLPIRSCRGGTSCFDIIKIGRAAAAQGSSQPGEGSHPGPQGGRRRQAARAPGPGPQGGQVRRQPGGVAQRSPGASPPGGTGGREVRAARGGAGRADGVGGPGLCCAARRGPECARPGGLGLGIISFAPALGAWVAIGGGKLF